MKKGQTKRIWTKEKKLEIIEKHLKEHICSHNSSRKNDDELFLADDVEQLYD